MLFMSTITGRGTVLVTVSTTDMTLTSMAPGVGEVEGGREVGVLEELPMRRRERASARVVVERDRGKTFEPKVPRGRCRIAIPRAWRQRGESTGCERSARELITRR